MSTMVDLKIMIILKLLFGHGKINGTGNPICFLRKVNRSVRMCYNESLVEDFLVNSEWLCAAPPGILHV